MRHNGTVKFFNTTKGYGFITPEDGSKDVFVHITAVQAAGIPDLSDDAKLSYELQDDKRGRGQQATELQLL
jgi:CspA family cold shock protein